MSEKILVKVNGEWTDDPGALAASLAAMAAKEELQAKLIAALEAEIARLREKLPTFCTVDGYPGKFEIQPLPPGPETEEKDNVPIQK